MKIKSNQGKPEIVRSRGDKREEIVSGIVLLIVLMLMNIILLLNLLGVISLQ